MATSLKKPKIAEYDAKACCRCGNPVRRGQMLEPVKINGEPYTRWCHVGCDFPGRRRKEPTGFEDAPQEEPKKLPEKMTGELDEFMVRTVVRSVVDEATDGMQDRVVANVKAKLEGPLTDLINRAVGRIAEEYAQGLPRTLVIKKLDGDTFTLKNEVLHEAFDDVKEMVELREDIFMPGPTGCGKTHLAQQVAKVLSMPFGMISCSKGMSEGMLNGRLIPRGKQGQFEFLTTMLLRIYEWGGLFLFDEMDAADANALLVINSALANGVMAVPNRHELPDGVTMDMYMEELAAYDRMGGEPFKYAGYGPYAVRHPDFVAIAAANTMGTGGDRMYVGRDPLDLSTLDRFLLGTIEVDYSRAVETSLCPDKELRETLWRWRDKIRENQLRRVMSTRFIIKAFKAKKLKNWSIDKIASRFFAGWGEDEIIQVYGRRLVKPDPAAAE